MTGCQDMVISSFGAVWSAITKFTLGFVGGLRADNKVCSDNVNLVYTCFTQSVLKLKIFIVISGLIFGEK